MVEAEVERLQEDQGLLADGTKPEKQSLGLLVGGLPRAFLVRLQGPSQHQPNFTSFVHQNQQ